MPQVNMPKDWQPPVDGWQSAYDASLDEIVFGYFGCQYRDGSLPVSFEDTFLAAATRSHEPAFVTRAHHRDASGYENQVFIAYWPSRKDFEAWWVDAGFGAWYEDDARLTEAIGVWREVYVVPIERFETLHSSKSHSGVARLAKPFGEPVREHNYWGGMRDRIPSSDTDSFAPDNPDLSKTRKLRQSRGARIAVAMGDNICLIRSGQNWSDCGVDELAAYSDEVVPHLRAGMAFLRDNPEETGCLSCRMMDELDLDGGHAQQSFGLAAFTSMADLESWAKTHPTHLRIFNSFLAMIQKRGAPPKLKLWHEVLVARGDDSICDYVNCHPNTGYLPWAG